MNAYTHSLTPTKKGWSATDLVKPQIVIPALIGIVVIFGWLNGMF